MHILNKIAPVGTRSILFGVHCWCIHPWWVALAWWRLYGFPSSGRLWLAFILHDIGYWGRSRMDDENGERHPEVGAEWIYRWVLHRETSKLARMRNRDVIAWQAAQNEANRWREFCLYHSRFYAGRDGATISRLCIADKLATALEPWWFYLPRAWLSGELAEYMTDSADRDSKYSGMTIVSGRGAVIWYKSMQTYLRQWAEENKDIDV